jgi:hypothetical protein
MSIAAAYQEVSSRQIESAEFADVTVRTFIAPADVVASDPLFGLTTVEFVRLTSWMSEWTSILFATWELRESGVVSDATYNIHADSFVGFLCFPHVKRVWESTVGTHPDAFKEDVRSRIPDQPIIDVP